MKNKDAKKTNKIIKTNKKLTIVLVLFLVVLSIIAILYFVNYFSCNADESKGNVDVPKGNSDFPKALKPLIYLYPKEEMKVNVKLFYEDKLTVTYPKYEDSWNVIAKPNGDLIDIKTNRSLYGLYWEGLNTVTKGMQDSGFVVEGKDVITFLENKLKILGLNERESNEFIIYWLSKLEINKYNYIRFSTIEEINKNMPLEILPNPDTVIRVNMEYKKLDEKIYVVEQKLFTPERIGFVVVEWGGTELK